MFSWQAELVSSMTTDQAALLDAVDGMVWPHWSTATALALSMAKTELTNSGRPEVPKESTIVFLLTDGNADSMWETKSAAEALKEVATLYVVVIGNNVNMRAVKTTPWMCSVRRISMGTPADILLFLFLLFEGKNHMENPIQKSGS